MCCVIFSGPAGKVEQRILENIESGTLLPTVSLHQKRSKMSETAAFFQAEVNRIIESMSTKDVYYLHPAAKMIKQYR